MVPMCSSAIFIIFYVIIAGFFLLWPVLIWSHLREQTKYLSEIKDILSQQNSKA